MSRHRWSITDIVQSVITWTLATNVENLALTGTSAFNHTGNTVDNMPLGNSDINTLTGDAGNDAAAGNIDVARFNSGIATDQLWLLNIGPSVRFVLLI